MDLYWPRVAAITWFVGSTMLGALGMVEIWEVYEQGAQWRWMGVPIILSGCVGSVRLAPVYLCWTANAGAALTAMAGISLSLGAAASSGTERGRSLAGLAAMAWLALPALAAPMLWSMLLF